MNDVERGLLEALNELERATASLRKEGAKADLLAIFARLEALSLRLPADANPRLRHYLQRKSYAKARLQLLGREGENEVRGCSG